MLKRYTYGETNNHLEKIMPLINPLRWKSTILEKIKKPKVIKVIASSLLSIAVISRVTSPLPNFGERHRTAASPASTSLNDSASPIPVTNLPSLPVKQSEMPKNPSTRGTILVSNEAKHPNLLSYDEQKTLASIFLQTFLLSLQYLNVDLPINISESQFIKNNNTHCNSLHLPWGGPGARDSHGAGPVTCMNDGFGVITTLPCNVPVIQTLELPKLTELDNTADPVPPGNYKLTPDLFKHPIIGKNVSHIYAMAASMGLMPGTLVHDTTSGKHAFDDVYISIDDEGNTRLIITDPRYISPDLSRSVVTKDTITDPSVWKAAAAPINKIDPSQVIKTFERINEQAPEIQQMDMQIATVLIKRMLNSADFFDLKWFNTISRNGFDFLNNGLFPNWPASDCPK